jgi:uncharacterized circularly permuted ATP-grasp superfamily protein/uncharacterized alpha-E superfamily protein
LADPALRLPAGQPSLFGEADSIGYGAGPVWDEMVTGTGKLRPHWQRFLSAHGPFTPEEMAARWDSARRLLSQNGVTYNLYAENGGLERPWPLDPVPLLLPAEEWRTIAEGVRQRARLLEAVLDDLYGCQTLLTDGVLPPGLVFNDPGYLRACVGVPPPGGIRLVLFAADLVRGPDGVWRVLASRTQSPTGAGYALENRVVLSQTLADSFRSCNVDRLAPFFEGLRATLARIAPRRSGPDGSARAVLLSPGPFNEAYFEHAYLARYLGLTLAEGADLTVRDQSVYLKTLAGLERVDVILRRVDDDWCDPLELKLDSALGVPGLTQAVRAGNVAVANALGSGLTDSPSFTPWMPGLCRRLLGEEPVLADVPTLWGGQPDQLAVLLERMEGLSLRPAFSAQAAAKAVFGPDLTRDRRADLSARIRLRPHAWVGQAATPPSTAPVWKDGRVEARPMVLRVFLCATGTGRDRDWICMPGGLARISADGRYPAVSLQEGAGAKDVWVVGGSPCAPARRRQTGPEAGRTEPAPVPGDMPSRAADHLFWVGRYAERADAAVRLLRAAASRMSDDSRPGAVEELGPLLRMLGWSGMVPTAIAETAPSRTPEAEILRTMRKALEIVGDPANPGGLRATIERLKRSAQSVRDRLPPDFNRLLSVMAAAVGQPLRGDPAGLQLHLDDLATGLSALAGLEQDGMSRGHGWRFVVMGRRLERAIGIAASLVGSGITRPQSDPTPALEVLLELADARTAYSERFPAGIKREPALCLLLADEEHPRSLVFQLDKLAKSLSKIPPAPPTDSGVSPTDLARSLVETAAKLVRDPAPARDPAALTGLTERLNGLLPEVSNLLSQAYFAHVFARPQ